MELSIDYSNEAEFPKELRENFQEFVGAVDNMEKVVKSLTSVPVADIHAEMKPINRAKFDLGPLYALTSLYWAYLKSNGVDPKTSSIPKELERIKAAMGKAKQIEEKSLAPKLDVDAAKRFIRSGLPAKENDTAAQTLNVDETTPPPAKRSRT